MGMIFTEEYDIPAKEHFRHLKKRYNIGFEISKKDHILSYTICVSLLESLAFISYSKEKSTKKRFQDLIVNYGGIPALQDEKLPQKVADTLWEVYRNPLVHENYIPSDLINNQNGPCEYIVYRLPEEVLKKSKRARMRVVNLENAYGILKNCIDNLEKEYSPLDESLFIIYEQLNPYKKWLEYKK